MLLDNFFVILEEEQSKSDSSTFVTKVKFNKSHQIFKGHFPSKPVVPGVCMIQMIKELVERNSHKKLRLTKSDNIKFLNMVSPEENEIVSFEINSRLVEGWVVKAAVVNEGKTFLKFSGVFE